MALTLLPNAGQPLNITRNPIRQNFVDINTAFNLDHQELATVNQGRHLKLSMPPIADPARNAAYMLVYCRTGVRTGTPELVVARESTSVVPANAQVNEFTAAVFGAQGWTRLPSGMLFIWDTINTGSTASNSNFNINFPAGANFPRFTAVYNIQITPTFNNPPGNDPQSAYYAGAVTIGNPGSFVVRQQVRALGNNTNQSTFSYLAIGIGA